MKLPLALEGEPVSCGDREGPEPSPTDRLWQRARDEGDAAARERLIETYVPFARMLAAKAFAQRTHDEHEFGDYFQYASVGLVEAVDRFDPKRGIKFEAFASVRITGAILNGLESLSEKQQQIAARKRILADRRESLKNSEGAVPAASALEYLAEIAIGLAVGFVLEDSPMYLANERTGPDNAYGDLALKQIRARVRKMVEALPDRERTIIKEHYFSLRTFDEIAQLLGLTNGRISQLHKQVLGKLHDQLRVVDKLDIET